MLQRAAALPSPSGTPRRRPTRSTSLWDQRKSRRNPLRTLQDENCSPGNSGGSGCGEMLAVGADSAGPGTWAGIRWRMPERLLYIRPGNMCAHAGLLREPLTLPPTAANGAIDASQEEPPTRLKARQARTRYRSSDPIIRPRAPCGRDICGTRGEGRRSD